MSKIIASVILLIRERAVTMTSFLAFASCSNGSAGGNASVVANATTIANHAAEAAYAVISSQRCHSIVGFVPGSAVLRDGELSAADERFRDLLSWKRKPIIVVAFGDNVTASGDAVADRRLALRRAAFVVERLKSFGVPVVKPLAIGGTEVRGSGTSAELYFSCPPQQ